jgi:hypothetical protein
MEGRLRPPTGRVQVPWTPLSLMDYELPFSLFGAD